MAKLREARAYRRVKRAYTRTSKYKEKSYVKGVPGSKIVAYDMGAKSTDFPYKVTLIAKKSVNLRHNAIEASRITAVKYLSEILGKMGFHLQIRAVPHQIMRENPLATGAGADRMQQGMRASFGKAIGAAAQIKEGKVIMAAFVEEKGVTAAKEALRKAASKYPIACKTEVEKVK
jgi:large subunit ribosomal protein L10e